MRASDKLNLHVRADAKSFRHFGKVGRLRSLGRQSLVKHKKGEQRGKKGLHDKTVTSGSQLSGIFPTSFQQYRPNDVAVIAERSATSTIVIIPPLFASSHAASRGHDVRQASITSS